MIDSHTHLVLCDGSRGRAWSPRPPRPGWGGCSPSAWTPRPTRRRSPPPSATRRSSPRSGATPTRRPGSTTRAAAEIARLGAHEKVRAIGETGLDYYRDTAAPADQRRAFAAQIEIAIELGLPIVIHARDPEGGSEAVDEIFATLDAKAAGHPVILHCFSAPAAGRRRGRARLVLLLRRQRHLPERRGAARGGGARCPRSCILVETDAPYLAPAAAARQAQRAGQRRRHRRGRRRGARRLLRAAGAHGRGQRPRALRLVAAPWSASARTSSPTPTCSTRSSATRSWRRTTSCSRSAPAKGC